MDVGVIDHLPSSEADYCEFTVLWQRKMSGFGVGGAHLDALSLLRQLSGVRVKTDSKYGAEHLNTYSLIGKLGSEGGGFWNCPLAVRLEGSTRGGCGDPI